MNDFKQLGTAGIRIKVASRQYSVTTMEQWLLAACDEIDRLRESEALGDKLIEARNEVLGHPVLQCPAHGQCIPHAIEVLDKIKRERDPR